MAFRNIQPGMKKHWAEKKTKDIRLRSIWENFSNRTNALPSIPNAKEHRVPKDALHYVSTEFPKGVYETIIPLIEALKEDGKGGRQIAEGSGETPNALFAKAYYNLSRKVIRVDTKGVENDATAYLRVAQEAHSQVLDWFAADKDFSCQMALLEGGDRYITEDEYWKEYQDMKTAPRKKLIHPNIAYTGMTQALTRNFAAYSYTSDMAAIVTALAQILGPDSAFNLNALDRLIEYAGKFIDPLSWSAGSGSVEYIILISPMQATQLMRDQAWVNLMSSAEKRGVENRAISGILGIRHNALIVEDMRSPILNLATQKFEYVTVTAANTIDNFYGLGRLNRATKGAAGQATGTVEIARVLGRGAIGIPLVHDVKFEEDNRDFSSQTELCGELSCGHNRLDFIGKNPDGTDRVKNVSSALYFTSTGVISY